MTVSEILTNSFNDNMLGRPVNAFKSLSDFINPIIFSLGVENKSNKPTWISLSSRDFFELETGTPELNIVTFCWLEGNIKGKGSFFWEFTSLNE